MKTIFEILETICIAIIFISIFVILGIRPVTVTGISMSNTLQDGDRVIISNLMYEAQKGDIVVVDKNNYFDKPIIKRVIATEGDKVFIDYSTGDVYVNDELLDEDYIYEKITPSNKENLDIIVPDGHVFLLGDNRNNSGDSRQSGTFDEALLLGEVMFRYYPLSQFGGV